MKRGEILSSAMEEKGYNKNTLSKKTGIAYSTIDSMIKRDLKNASIDNVLKICKVLGISSEVFEKDTMPSNLHEIESEFVKVPILGEIACGDPLYVEENFDGYRVEPKSNIPSGNTYYLKAKGDSMSPTVPQDAFVLIREQSDVENGEIAAVLVNDDSEATLKRVRKSNGTIMLIPDNNKYDPIIVNESYPCKILGRAIRFTFDL